MNDRNNHPRTLPDIVAELRMGFDGGRPAYRIGRCDKVEISMPSGQPIRSYVIEEVHISELADWIEAAVARERRQYERLHDCFWDKRAVQCIIRRMRDSRDDLARAYPTAASELDYFADELIRARCERAVSNKSPRNCDRFADETDAQLAFLNEVWLISVDRESMLERDRYENWTDEMRARYGQWLLAPAQAQEGGAS